MLRALWIATSLLLATPAAIGQIVWQSGLGPFHGRVDAGLEVNAVGRGTRGAGPFTLDVPGVPGDFDGGYVFWSLRTDFLVPLQDTISIDGQLVIGELVGEASPPPTWNKLQLAVYAGVLPAGPTPGSSWTLDGVGDKPLGAEPAALGEHVTVLLFSTAAGFPTRAVDVSAGYASTESDSWTPGVARIDHGLANGYPGGGLHLLLDAIDGQLEDGTGAGSDTLFVGTGPAGGVLAGTGGPQDAWRGHGQGPGAYDLLDDDPAWAALVPAGADAVEVRTRRLPPVGDSVGHAVLATAHRLEAGAWSTAGPASGTAAAFAPLIDGTGTLTSGAAGHVLLAGAEPLGTVHLVIGSSVLFAPFKGGVLGPFPTLLLSLPADGQGRLDVPYVWPALPAGLPVWIQAWLPAPSGWRSSRTLHGVSD